MDIFLKIRPVIQNSIVRIMKTVQYVRNSVAYNMHWTAFPGLKLCIDLISVNIHSILMYLLLFLHQRMTRH